MNEQAGIDPRFSVADDALDRWRNDFPIWIERGGRRIWVAEAAGTLVGFVTAQQWAPLPIFAASEEVYVDELYVVPASRKQGVGRLLIGTVEAWGTELGAGRLRLGVLASNAGGQRFWEHLKARPYSVTMTIDLAQEPRSAPPRKGPLGF